MTADYEDFTTSGEDDQEVSGSPEPEETPVAEPEVSDADIRDADIRKDSSGRVLHPWEVTP